MWKKGEISETCQTAWTSGDGGGDRVKRRQPSDGSEMSSLEGQENGGTMNRNRQVMTAFCLFFEGKGCVCVCV